MSGRLVGAVMRDGLEDAPPRARRSLRAVLLVLADAAGREGLARSTSPGGPSGRG